MTVKSIPAELQAAADELAAELEERWGYSREAIRYELMPAGFYRVTGVLPDGRDGHSFPVPA